MAKGLERPLREKQPIENATIKALRSDKKLLLRARRRLLRHILEDIDHWYDVFKTHAVIAEKNSDPAVRMALGVINKLLVDQRESVDLTPPPASSPVQVIIGVGIDRGTKDSRARALQHQQQQRITLTLDGEGEVITDSDEDLRSERIGETVPPEPGPS